jgi:hypothetical protein
MTATAPNIDLIAYDAEDRPVLLVEVKGATRGSALEEQTIAYLTEVRPPARETIRLFDGDQEPGRLLCTLMTADVLSFYDADFRTKPVYHFYLGILVEGWLMDLACHWKSQSPPAEAEMAAVGLLARLKGGTTRSGVPVHGGDPLR